MTPGSDLGQAVTSLRRGQKHDHAGGEVLPLVGGLLAGLLRWPLPRIRPPLRMR